jgi:hypothetical protein
MAIDAAGQFVAETRVAAHLRHLILAATARTPDLGDLKAAVREACEAGETWDLISMALGLSPEEAVARFG